MLIESALQGLLFAYTAWQLRRVVDTGGWLVRCKVAIQMRARGRGR
jgi:hypothetical protein